MLVPGHAGGALVEDVAELLLGPFDLALSFEVGAHEPLELDQQLDVEGGVVAPVAGQRTIRPVGGRMLLGEGDAEVVLGDRGESEAMQTEQARGQFGVEEPPRLQADVGEARQVHHRIVQDPDGIADGVVEFVPVGTGPGERHGVEQEDAGALALELDEPVLMPVSEAGGPFGVGGQRARGGRQRLARLMVAGERVGDRRHSPARLGLQSRFGSSFLSGISQRLRPR
ncbi:hypothetical protein BCAL_1556 [Bifidobacterium callitrichos DSM 23973]|uniref:Uncharacterized protein n=1 Tax=Bifidobacterium callitrichos DSM 23973 TaxID=1437609 RepID=A0A087A277_9BIFI|nr:hypothetical protein BCAL_1556 [Bifidobacterium callitrichos DSM 23973]